MTHVQCGRAAHKWICYHGAPRGVRRRIRLMQRPGRGFRGESAGAAGSRRPAGTGRTATARSTRAGRGGLVGRRTVWPTDGPLGSGAATAGALVRRLVHASLRMRRQTSTPACGRGGRANSAPGSRLAQAGATAAVRVGRGGWANSAPGSRLARAGATAAVHAPRENRRAVAYQPESQVQPPGPGHAREDRTRFGAQQEAKAYLMDSQLAWRDLAAKRLRACHEIPPALSWRWHDEAPYGDTQLRERCAQAGLFSVTVVSDYS